MLSSYSYSDRETPISILSNLSNMESENQKLRDENKRLKDETEKLKEQIKSLVYHSDGINKILRDLSNVNDRNVTQMNQTVMSSAKKNAYDEYENRPVRSRLTMNEWEWENRPIKPASILVNSNFDYQRRRSKSVCFGEKNLIHELNEIDNNRTNNSDTCDAKVVEEKPDEKAQSKHLDTSEEENLKKEKPLKKPKGSKAAPKQPVSKVVAKIAKERVYNLDTSSESAQDDSRNEMQKQVDIQAKNAPPVQTATNKCNCSGDCLSNRCSCKKSSTGCSSKCHNGNPCKNC